MITSKLRVIVGAAIVVAGCAGRDDSQTTATSTEAMISPAPTAVEHVPLPPSQSTDVYIMVEPPAPCLRWAAPCLDGFWVHELDRDSRLHHVSGFDIDHLAPGTMEQAVGGLRSLILRGQFEPADKRTGEEGFIVLEAWRPLPDIEARWWDQYFTVEATGDTYEAHPVNTNLSRPVEAFSLSGVDIPYVDTAWLTSRVLAHGAIVPGRIVETTLEVGNVFIRLPDIAGPCPLFRLYCGNETATYSRDGNRCFQSTGCVERHLCPQLLPVCSPGYSLVSWASQPDGCLAFACDPSFLNQ